MSTARLPDRPESWNIPTDLVSGAGPPAGPPVASNNPNALSLAERLAEEMRARWRNGERPTAEEFLNRHPELWQQPEEAADLIYEEFCLRREQGEEVDPQAVLARFRQWQAPLGVLLECHRILDPEEARFPSCGEKLGEYRLVAELGRGSQGRVFLAVQPALADRPVVLKLTQPTGQEHLSLARVQHTHIVPLYTAYDDQERQLRVLVMPYFGGATLAQLLAALGDVPLAERTGCHLLAALDRIGRKAPVPSPRKGPYRETLERKGYDFVQTVCAIAACLAEALQFAHERGLLHLDLKPSNVLVAADATPMLLDFHLARGPLCQDQAAPEWLGGTLAYMPREQQAALVALCEGRPIPAAVDAQADVYALGAILYEALGGQHPYLPGVSPRLSRCNPGVSEELADLVHKCLAYKACDRYPDARSVERDLRYYLNGLPLEGVEPGRRRRRSARRWQKAMWWGWAIAPLMAVATAGGVWMHSRSEQAILARQEASRVEQARAAATELHDLADRLRPLHGVNRGPSPELWALDDDCHRLWERRTEIWERLAPDLPAEGRAQLKADLLDFARSWSDLRIQLAANKEAGPRAALQIIAEAQELAGPNPLLTQERDRHARSVPQAARPADGQAP